jgi:hypothetical protein
MALDPLQIVTQANQAITSVANGAKSEIEKVTTQIQGGVSPVVTALTEFQKMLTALGADSGKNLDKLLHDAMDTLSRIADGLEDVGGELKKFNVWVSVTVDGQTVVLTEPTEIYRAIIGAVEPQNATPPREVVIRCGGAVLFPQLAPLAGNKDGMRAFLLGKAMLPPNAPVLVKNPADWVIACALICFTICVLAVLAPPAFGVAAVLFCIGAALLVAVVLGYEVDIEVEQNAAASMTLPLGIKIESGPAVKMKLTRRAA